MKHDKIPTLADWRKYAEEKAKIQAKCLEPQEYEAQIKALVNRLGL